MRPVLPAVLLAPVLVSCVLDEVELEGKRCPCTPELTCVAGVCVSDAAETDASFDASTRDADRRDATVHDGGPIDAAAPIDVGPRDTGAADAGFDAGSDRTACDDALAGASFCDGFEMPTFARWTPGERVRDGTVARVTDVVYRGEGALRARTRGPSGYARLDALIPPIVSGDVWLRFYTLLPTGTPVVHFDTGFAREGVMAYAGFVVSMSSGNDRPYVWVDEAESAYRSTAALERDVWTCIQAHVTISSTDGSLELFVGGTMTAAASGIDTSPPAGYGLASIGITWSDTDQPAATMYFDELAVGTTPLPCDP